MPEAHTKTRRPWRIRFERFILSAFLQGPRLTQGTISAAHRLGRNPRVSVEGLPYRTRHKICALHKYTTFQCRVRFASLRHSCLMTYHIHLRLPSFFRLTTLKCLTRHGKAAMAVIGPRSFFQAFLFFAVTKACHACESEFEDFRGLHAHIRS